MSLLNYRDSFEFEISSSGTPCLPASLNSWLSARDRRLSGDRFIAFALSLNRSSMTTFSAKERFARFDRWVRLLVRIDSKSCCILC